MTRVKDLHLRVPSALGTRIAEISSIRGISVNALIIGALEDTLSDKGIADRDEDKRILYDLERRLKELRSDVEILGEFISFFVLHWLCYTPEISEDYRKAILVEGKERHKRFLQLFSKRIVNGEFSFLSSLSENQKSL